MFPDIDTPAVLIDLDVAERNIRHFQDYCTEHGLALRPHIKTHKLPRLAHLQMAAGAVGVNCQKLGEAEVMADAGLEDILITYNILGPMKLARLKALADRVPRLAVTADNPVVVDGLAETFAGAERPLTVRVECDTGARRCGVATADEALALARRIDAAPGLAFGGLLTYPAPGGVHAVRAFFQDARKRFDAAGLDIPVLSSGGSPDMWRAHEAGEVTEYRAGTYVYNDRSLIAAGACHPADCALTVLSTVVSTPGRSRVIVDAGSKVLTTDLFGQTGYGMVAGRPEFEVTAVSEEHGHLMAGAGTARPRVGERLRIIPNHACVVSNMVDHVVLVRGDKVVATEPVAARGRVT
ncbi:MAG: D-TA family PLP-dependent enzyme [Rhodobacterales bacterium]|nr:D-TA family PLP-dependent enzyme [Rhodobacterales bacterium]